MATRSNTTNKTRKNTGKSASSARSNSSRSSSRSNSRTTSRTTTKTAKSSGNRAPVQENTSVIDYFHAFSKTRLFAPIMTIFGIILGVLLDLLISWNNYDRFFFILGLELIIIAGLWIAFLLLRLGSDVISET